MAIDAVEKGLILINSTNGNFLQRIDVAGARNLNIKNAMLLHLNATNTYAAYFVSRFAAYYTVTCLIFDLTPATNTVTT